MFLATTANQIFWKPGEHLLFLGEWCKIYSRKYEWSKFSHEVLPYHGVDRDKRYKDYIYAMEVYERSLVQLSKELNQLHGLSCSPRYWRIVLGPWLSYFIAVLLDRYRSICIAENSGKVKNTWITPDLPDRCLPNDFLEFRVKSNEDDYNHCLFSQIIKNSKKIPWEENKNSQFLDFKLKQRKLSDKKYFMQKAILFFGYFSRFIPDSLQSVVLDQSYIKPFDIMKLQLSMKTMPCPYRHNVKLPSVQTDWELRQRIKLTSITNDGFESILQRCIPLQIPKVYIEGYSTMAQRALEIYPKKTKIIITSNSHKVNEGFKFWAATQVDKGVKLVITQHGGHVGDALWSMDDDHEIAIADRYFTWGWDRNNEKKTVPVPSSMLGGIKKNFAPNQTGPILCVTSSYLRYPYQMFAVPDGPMSLDTQMLQENFLGKISSEISKILVFRLFEDQGWEESLRWQDSDVCPQIYKGKMSYHSHLSLSRLCICFYNGTPFLETFSANYPTLICWDPRCSELNELAQPYFGSLREAGILHDNSDSIALKLNEIYQDPLAWWLSPLVQDAKDNFCDRFARVSEDWLDKWKSELSKLA